MIEKKDLTIEKIEIQRQLWLSRYYEVPSMLERILTALGRETIIERRPYRIAELKDRDGAKITILGQVVYGYYSKECGRFYMVQLGADYQFASFNGRDKNYKDARTVIKFLDGRDDLGPGSVDHNYITPGPWIQAIKEAAIRADALLSSVLNKRDREQLDEMYQRYALDLAVEVEI